QRGAPGPQILLNEEPPDHRRNAQADDTATRDRVERRLNTETLEGIDEDGRADDPEGEEAAPDVLDPTKRADVEMHVVEPEPQPIHRREVPYRITLIRMQHELGLGRRPGGEIEQQRIARRGVSVRRERGRNLADSAIVDPTDD